MKKAVPASNLLMFQVKDGWEPHFEFLGVSMPDKPFPTAKTYEVYLNVIKINSVDKNTQFLTLFSITSEVFYIRHFIVDLTLASPLHLKKEIGILDQLKPLR